MSPEKPTILNTTPADQTAPLNTQFDNPTCKKCREPAKTACPGCKTKVVQDVPEVKNYSQTKRLAIRFIGLDARVWHDNEPTEPKVMVGRDMKPGRLVLGFGDTFQEALEKAVAAHRG